MHRVREGLKASLANGPTYPHRPQRRRVLVWLGAALGISLVLAGCSSGGIDDRTDGLPRDPGKLTSRVGELRIQCYAADMAACDDLARFAAKNPAVLEYALTCGGRIVSPAGQCASRFAAARPGEPTDGSSTSSTPLTELAKECEAGDLLACDELIRSAPEGSEHHQYGVTCGQRWKPVTSCVERKLPPALPLEFAVSEVDRARAEACHDGDLESCDQLRDSADAEVALYGKRCGGRSSDVDSCVEAFRGLEASEIPDGLPLSLPGAAANPSADACFDGSLAACDKLRGAGKRLAAYGASCGGRLEPVESCVDAFLAIWPKASPAKDLGRELDQLAYACRGSHWTACDELARRAAEAVYPDHHRYGATCGGRMPERETSCDQPPLSDIPAAGDPTAVEDKVETGLRELAKQCYRGDYERCQRLARQAPRGYEDFRTYGATCGGFPVGSLPSGCTPDGTTSKPATSRGTAKPTTTRGTAKPTTTKEKAEPTTTRETAEPTTTRETADGQGKPPPVPPPPRLHRRVAAAVLDAVEPHLVSSGVLEVGQKSKVTVRLDRDVRVKVASSTLKQVAQGGGEEIEIVIRSRIVGDLAELDGDSQQHAATLVLTTTEKTVEAALLGTFTITPKRPGVDKELQLEVTESVVNRRTIRVPREVTVTLGEVFDKPRWKRLRDWLTSLEPMWKAIGALAALVSIVGGIAKWRAGRSLTAS